MHGTLRVRAALPSLRGAGVFRAVSDALAASSRRGFRVLEFSIQSNHIDLLVEADDRTRLSRGLQGLKSRIARAANGTLHRRGTFWAGRYHARALATPREVRTALVYVLRNGHRHGTCRRGFDPCSSAAWFTGWKCSRPRPICLAPSCGRRRGSRRSGGADMGSSESRKNRPRRAGSSARSAAKVRRSTRGLLPASPPQDVRHTRDAGSRRARSASSTRFTGTGTPARAAARTTAPLRASCSRRRPRR
ncbi:MAG: hypothetical protein E6J69_15620 [Deltaproteobacteria bacterium]|nr:MAG: hypothetical protein E6J69_15620 [Deltaproteobacteria bacterium]